MTPAAARSLRLCDVLTSEGPCGSYASKTPVIRMRMEETDEGVEGQIDIALCECCARQARVEDVLTDEVYALVRARMVELGHPAPDRSTAVMHFVDHMPSVGDA